VVALAAAAHITLVLAALAHQVKVTLAALENLRPALAAAVAVLARLVLRQLGGHQLAVLVA
jgi:hypothetical protein